MSFYQLTPSDLWDHFSLFVSVALGLVWVFFWLAGQLTLSYFPKKYLQSESNDLFTVIQIGTGIWVSTTVFILLGLCDLFSREFMFFLGLGIVLLSYQRKLRLWPFRGLIALLKSDPYLSALGIVSTFLLGLVAFYRLNVWIDGNYAFVAKHLARTGRFVFTASDGQMGMSILAGMIAAFLPDFSVINSASGLAPFFGPLLVFGPVYLIRELEKDLRWDSVVWLALCLPLVFRAPEIRGAIAAFGFSTWSLVFFFRYLKRGSILNGYAASLGLALAWNFSPQAALYEIIFLGIWSIRCFCMGDSASTLRIWRIFGFTNAIEWLHFGLTFSWNQGAPSREMIKSFLPGTATLIICVFMIRFLERKKLPKLHLPLWINSIFALIAVGSAIATNPSSQPMYNWIGLNSPTWFFPFNFSSFGMWGYLFLFALILSVFDLHKKTCRPSVTVLWIGFSVSCLVQTACALLFYSQLNILGERANIWDLWKDTAQFFHAPLMIVALLVLAQKFFQGKRWKRVTRYHTNLALFVLVCIDPYSTSSYEQFFAPANNLKEQLIHYFSATFPTHVDSVWSGQRAFSLPMYLAHALNWVEPKFMESVPFRRADCKVCPILGYWVVSGQEPMINFLMKAPVSAGQTFVSSDSVFTNEYYVNRQLRYSNGVNTICTEMIDIFAQATAYEAYWLPKNKIRRGNYGWIYTVTAPEVNLIWTRDFDNFRVPRDGDYELYRGNDWSFERPSVMLNGIRIDPDQSDRRTVVLPQLKVGVNYQIQVLPRPGTNSLNPSFSNVIYPIRNQKAEYAYLEWAQNFTQFHHLIQARYSGIGGAPIAIDELELLLTSPDPSMRQKILKKYQTRYIILDAFLQQVYKEALAILSNDTQLRRIDVEGTPVFEYQGD